MVVKNSLVALLGLSFSVAAYSQGVDILGNAGSSLKTLKLTVIADSKLGLNAPSDIAINPLKPTDLYVVNHGDNSAVVLTLDATGNKVAKSRLATALGAEHFMPNPTGIAFAPSGFFATIHDINTVTQDSTPWDFMGPTLWTQTWFDGGHGSHMDMLHNSPSGIGIAWVHGNTYVVNDGAHGAITVYDFRNDHNYGGADHSDGVTLRYADGLLERVEGVPSHIVFDKASGVAYAVDTGHNRVVGIDLGLDYLTKSGFDYISIKNKDYKVSRNLEPNYDGTIQRYVDGPVAKTVIDGAKAKLSTPSGIALYKDTLYVSDYTSGQIHAFSKEGQLLDSLTLSDILPAAANSALSGIEFDAKGNLYITDLLNNRVYRLEAVASAK
ncbi:MAG: hypothetical protein EOP07_08160 [Proteobacteria bacterium]|nr:MAG: hypothetical protein EOP07_08160 [Pseudomonadota bacterium]